MARQRRGVELGVLMLVWQFLQGGVQSFPPVTVAVVVFQVMDPRVVD